MQVCHSSVHGLWTTRGDAPGGPGGITRPSACSPRRTQGCGRQPGLGHGERERERWNSEKKKKKKKKKKIKKKCATLLTSTCSDPSRTSLRAPIWGQPVIRAPEPNHKLVAVLPPMPTPWQDAHPGAQEPARAVAHEARPAKGPVRHQVKFTVERDVLADAVAWAARSLPVRPSVPVLAGLLIETGRGRRRPAAVDVRLRDLRPCHAARLRAGRGQGPGLGPAAHRHLPQPAEQARRDDLDGSKVSLTCGSARFSLQTMPVEEYPALPDMPPATGTVAQRPVLQRGLPGRHRRRPRRHAAGAHRRPDRDRGLDDLAAGHRPVPASSASSVGPAHHRRLRGRARARSRCSRRPRSR